MASDDEEKVDKDNTEEVEKVEKTDVVEDTEKTEASSSVKVPKKSANYFMKNKWIVWTIGVLVVLTGIVVIFGTPSAETVFKDMNEQMLKTKSVTVNTTLTTEGSDGSAGSIKSSLYMNMNSSEELLAKGDFNLELTNSATPMTVSGDLLKIGDSKYVKFTELSSTDANISAVFGPAGSAMSDKWVKIRDGDQYATIANAALDFSSSVLPMPYANLTDTQIKDVLTILRDDSMYKISESAKVETSGVSAYKYSLSYDKDQYHKLEKAISGYVKYFKQDDKTENKLSSLTVWVDISTKQIIKIEFEGKSGTDKAKGLIEFSGYNKDQTVEKPSDYFIESELLN